jgi:two-component system, NtrC family, response regulator AtoC
MSRSTKPVAILVADDDSAIRGNLALLLRSEGFAVAEASDGAEALAILNEGRMALALLDLKMPKLDGMDVLRRHAEHLDETPVIVITAFGGSSAPIEAMKLGAYDYITKPFDLDEVLFTVRRALVQRSLIAQVEALSVDPLSAIEIDAEAESELIGRSPAMLTAFKTIGLVAPTEAPVLVLGESGTGKELVANAIHRYSDRVQGPFVKVNCAALSAGLLESELFGHEKGAFTGAIARRRGRFEHADKGTLFLDEIAEMDVDLQAKMLRVLQTGRFERVGGEETVATNVRVIAATNRDLAVRIKEGKFREDLYFRINVMTIHLPPLRERLDDVPLLAEHLIHQLGRQYHWPHLALAAEALDELKRRGWPGNVRELRNVLARAAILARGRVIQRTDLDAARPTKTDPPAPASGTLVLREALAEVERRVIRQALEQENWNRTQAARVLGISRRQLFDKIREYELQQ